MHNWIFFQEIFIHIRIILRLNRKCVQTRRVDDENNLRYASKSLCTRVDWHRSCTRNTHRRLLQYLPDSCWFPKPVSISVRLKPMRSIRIDKSKNKKRFTHSLTRSRGFRQNTWKYNHTGEYRVFFFDSARSILWFNKV